MIDAVGNVPEDVLARLTILFTTPKGSVPLDRAFGIDLSFLDLPTNRTRVKLLESCVVAIKQYEPEYKVADVIFSGDGTEGTLKTKVVIGYAD